MSDRAALPLPVVTITTERSGPLDRVTGVEVDGVPIPRVTQIKVVDQASAVTTVTITILAGRVERVVQKPPERPVEGQLTMDETAEI